MAKTVKQVRAMMLDEEFGQLNEIVSLGSEATRALTQILQDDSDPLMRQRAAIALGRMSDPQCEDAMVDALEDRDAPVVIAAIDGLVRMGSRKAAPGLRELRRRRDVSLKARVVNAVGALGSDEDVKWLRSVLARDQSSVVREAASAALTALTEREASPNGVIEEDSEVD
jgi:HEAT repeat protein